MKHVGILIPETNTVVENEITCLCACDPLISQKVSFHYSRIEIESDYARDEVGFLKEVHRNKGKAFRLFRTIPVDIAALFCTSVRLAGNGVNEESDSDTIDGFVCLDPLRSIVSAASRFEARNVLLFSPYRGRTAELLKNNLTSAGIRIQKNVFLELSKDIDKYAPTDAQEYLQREIEPQTDLVVISCTNFRTLDTLSFLEEKCRTPAISSNQSLFWSVCRNLDIKCDGLIRYGSIFRL